MQQIGNINKYPNLSNIYKQYQTLKAFEIQQQQIMDQRNPLPGRITHRLNLDSEQEQQREQQERRQRQQYEREKQEKRKRKQEKRKAKEQEQRAAQEAAQKKAQEKKKQVEKYNNPATLFQPDSDSGVSFSRIKRKIEEMYPKYSKKKQRMQSSSQSESQQESVSQQQSQSQQGDSEEEGSNSSPKKKQKNSSKKQVEKKRRNQSDSQQHQNKKKQKSAVKMQPQMSSKDKLVQQVVIRWYYALPEWPPVDYDYDAELKKRGYRNVDFVKFKFVDEVVDGLTKVHELDGYRGVYRGKKGLIDVRPKETCPTLDFFYAKSEQQLVQILKKALAAQLQQLENVQFKQNGEQKLLEDLKRRIKQLSR